MTAPLRWSGLFFCTALQGFSNEEISMQYHHVGGRVFPILQILIGFCNHPARIMPAWVKNVSNAEKSGIKYILINIKIMLEI